MSGIAGIVHFDGQPVEPGLIEKMTRAMAHRGPDGIHHWVKGSVALGQFITTPAKIQGWIRRLRRIHQPPAGWMRFAYPSYILYFAQCKRLEGMFSR